MNQKFVIGFPSNFQSVKIVYSNNFNKSSCDSEDSSGLSSWQYKYNTKVNGFT